MSSAPWPPPPDIESIRELMRSADPEGLIAGGCPADEYEPEEDALFATIHHLPTAELVCSRTMPILEAIWKRSFGEDVEGDSPRRVALANLAAQIERFFGPEATPQVRS